MSRRAGTGIAALLLVLACDSAESQLPQANLRLTLLLASDYRHNGLSQTDGDGAARVSVDYARAEHPRQLRTGWRSGIA